MKQMKRKSILRALICSDENFFSFFSAVISNIPISLLLTLNKEINGNIILYWAFFGCAILFSCISALSLLVFTIKKIHIKENARKAYDEEIMKLGQSIEKLCQTHLEDEYDSHYKSLKRWFFLSICCLLIVVGAIIGLWIIK